MLGAVKHANFGVFDGRMFECHVDKIDHEFISIVTRNEFGVEGAGHSDMAAVGPGLCFAVGESDFRTKDEEAEYADHF